MKTTLLFAFRTLVALVLAFALIGFLHLFRGTVVRHVRGDRGRRRGPAVSKPQFPLAVTMLTGAVADGRRTR